MTRNTLLKSTLPEKERAILLACDLFHRGEEETESLLEELRNLVSSTGGEVLGSVVQKKDAIDPHYYLGKGKLEEVKGLIKSLKANVVVCDDELTPNQVRTLDNLLQVKVLDRSQVILDIFSRRAQSKEGKIQVELAQLEYLLPRLAGGRRWLSRLGGGIGTRGPGETKLELDRRLVRSRIHRLKAGLEEVRKEREILRESRSKKSFFLASLLGYTNAGKSTLFRRLTGEDTVISERLFSTLDPKVRRLKDHTEILLTDTVGFIRKIPHHLLTAFRATLEEARSADLLLLVVDGSDSQAQAQIQVARGVIHDLDLYGKPILTVINKIDRVENKLWLQLLMQTNHPAIATSALKGEGLEELKASLVSYKERQSIVSTSFLLRD